jgi:protein-S-isoprenylcysteine O-methyltransferase Ste14
MNTLELKIPPVVVGTAVALLAWFGDGLAFAEWSGSRLGAMLWSAAGVFVAIAGLWSFARARTSVNPHRPGNASSLVTWGIYRVTRNPMYLGMLMVLIGWALYLGGALPLLATGLFIPYMNRFQIEPEERVMAELFGDQFEQYIASVRRWI